MRYASFVPLVSALFVATLISAVARPAAARDERPPYAATGIESWRRVYPPRVEDLRPGDVLLYRAYEPKTGAFRAEGRNLFERVGNQVLGVTISGVTGFGAYRHAALYVGNGHKAETVDKVGGRVVSVGGLDGVEVYRNGNTAAATAAARDAIGRAPLLRYDYAGIATFGRNLLPPLNPSKYIPVNRSEGGAICSEFVNSVLSDHGIGIVDARKMSRSLVAPNYLGYALGKQHLVGKIGAALRDLVVPEAEDGRRASTSSVRGAPFLLRSSFLPFQPPWGGGGGAVTPGGVWFDQAARVLGDIGDVRGLVYDNERGLILVGERAAETKLPPINIRDFALILRRVFDGKEPLLFSLDPDPANPQGPKMFVNYFDGGLANRATGHVPLMADFLMKALSLGRDPRTKQPFRSQIEGYADMTELALGLPAADGQPWNRFWLTTPEQGVVLRISPDRAAIAVERAMIIVQTEPMEWRDGHLVSATNRRDEQAEYFARWFTANYDAIAREQPVFAELRSLAVLVGIAKWMRDSGLPIDLGWTERFEEHVPTPTEMPAMTVQRVGAVGSARGVSQTVHVYGGVGEMHMFPAVDDGKAAKLQSAVRAARTAGPGPAFPLQHDGRELHAVALPGVSVPALGSYSTEQTDLVIDVGGQPVPLTRYFNSFHNEPTPFGRGWTFNLPRLVFRNPGKPGEEQYISVREREGTQVRAQHFSLRDDLGTLSEEFAGGSIDQELARVGFAATSTPSMRGVYPEQDGTYLLLMRDGSDLRFDGKGRLTQRRDRDASVTYTWMENRLTEVSAAAKDGRPEVIHIDYDDAGRIRALKGPTGTASYEYAGDGNLAEVRTPDDMLTYQYDRQHLLLTIARDREVLWEGSYDALGRLIGERSAGRDMRVAHLLGEQGAVVTLSDEESTADLSFNSSQQLVKIEDGSQTIAYAYHPDRRLRTVTLHDGLTTRSWEMLPDGRTVAMRDSAGVVEYQLDEGLQIASVRIDGQPAAGVQ